MEQYYSILGLSPGASQDEIKSKYKEKAFATHPDRNNGNSEEFLKVTEAYEILSGKKQAKQQEQPFNPFGGGFDFGQMFNFNFNPFGEQQEKRPPEKESDMGIRLELTIEEIINGKTYNIEYQKSYDCDKCSGVGGKSKAKCQGCFGSGVVRQQHSQGGMTFQNVGPCQNCSGRGSIIQEPCSGCEAKGYKTKKEKLSFKIESEK